MDSPSECFLPNFCAIPMVFAVVVTAELLAFVLTLAGELHPQRFWMDLGLRSLYIQWITVAATALLCLVRPWLRGLSHAIAGLAAWALILLVTGTVSFLAVYTVGVGSDQEGRWLFILQSLAVTAIVAALVLRYMYEQFRQKHRELAAANARLDALQARIRPHFLFNSMNTIAGLTRRDPVLAEKIVEDLSELFRASLSDPSRLTTLDREIELAKSYLQIEAQRLGDRLRVAWDLQDLPYAAAVPPLLLQPLVENAVYHGVEPSANGGSVLISGRYRRDRINLSVRNSLPSGQRAEREGNRVALQNLRDRLAVLYGDDAGLVVGLVDGEYQVRVHFPLRDITA